MRSLTVAFTTFQESVRQPVFYTLVVLGTVLLVFSFVMPTFTMGIEEVKFVRDMGLGTYTLCILLLGIFSAANLITTEIENKTAMTVMSKPLRRYEFVIGKFLGIAFSVAFLGVLLATVFVAIIVAKVTSGDIVSFRTTAYESVWPNVEVVFPGLILGLFETLILTAVSVALSTRLPMVLNVSISFGLFIIASISGPVVDYLQQQNSNAYRIAKVFYYILPNFQSNTETYSAIGLGRAVPFGLVALTVLYSILYISVAIAAGILLFQDRELG